MSNQVRQCWLRSDKTNLDFSKMRTGRFDKMREILISVKCAKVGLVKSDAKTWISIKCADFPAKFEAKLLSLIKCAKSSFSQN